jgi:predicted regulator of Ras-like GTPase activity (Roadblock/LC7/MglB family)
MIDILAPLAATPGVRTALLVLPDGVPLVVRNRSDDEESDLSLPGETDESLAALASGWLSELTRAVAPLGWDVPQRVVMRAARGTLVMCSAPRSVLLVVLDRGASPEDLRLPMEGAVARIQRLMRGAFDRTEPAIPAHSTPTHGHGSSEGLVQTEPSTNPPHRES